MPDARIEDVSPAPLVPPPDDEGPVAPADATPGAPPRRRRLQIGAVTGREIILALGLLFCYGIFSQSPSWNEFSRYDLVRAVVEDHTMKIDRYEQNTGDKSYYNGHYYSDKAPGTAIVGIPAYAVQALLADVAGTGTPDPSAAVSAIAFVASGIPTALLVILLLRFLRPTVGEPWAMVISVGYGLGSIAFPLATMLFGHALSTACLFGAFYLLWRWRTDRRGWRPVVAGLLAGCAVLTEMPVVIGVAVLGVYALWLGRGQAVRFVAGGIPAALVLFGYDWVNFGGPLSLGYQYSTVFGQQNSTGFFSMVWPSWSSAVDLLIGPRGLIRCAPWFVVAPLGVLAWRRRSVRPEVAVCVAICCAFFVYNSGLINPFGGWTPGPRYLLPALPFAAILVGLAPTALRPLVAVLIGLSMAIFFVATVTMPNAPELYQDPLYGLWLPRLAGGAIAQTAAWMRWGLHGLQPLMVLATGLTAAAVAIMASFRETAWTRRLTAVVGIALVVLIVAFSFPLVPPTALAGDLLPAGAPGSIVIAETGAVPIRTSTKATAMLWAQIENRGAAKEGARIVFTTYGPDGKQSWSAWYGDVAWAEGERKNPSIEWDTTTVAAGDYPYSITVTSGDGKTVLAQGPGGVVHIRR